MLPALIAPPPRHGDVDGAITFAQQHLAPYRDPALLQRHVCHPQLSIKEAQAFLEEVVALIAYPDPATCACGWILGQPQRERVADIANRAVLDAMVRCWGLSLCCCVCCCVCYCVWCCVWCCGGV